MRVFRRGALVVALAAAAMVLPALARGATVVIDDFTTATGPNLQVIPNAGVHDGVSVSSGSGIVGGERDIHASSVQGVGAGLLNNNALLVGLHQYLYNGFYAVAQDDVSGHVQLQWDGADGNAAALNPTGLGGADLTGGGANDKFVLDASYNLGLSAFTVTVYTDGTHHSSSHPSIPSGPNGVTSEVSVPFSSFSADAGAAGPADFAHVGAVTLDWNTAGGGPYIDLFEATETDSTPPTITASAATADGEPYTSGTWTKQDVLVSFSCTDASGVRSVSSPVWIRTSGASQTAAGSCTDNVGNRASTTFTGIDIDKTGPVVHASATAGGRAYSAGTWTNQDVVVSFTCTDALSGVAIVPDPVTVSTPGAGQSAVGTCTDTLGNATTATFSNIDVDRTAPTLTLTGMTQGSSGMAYTGSWTWQDVTVTYSCTDGESGTATPAPSVAFTANTNGTGTVTCSDRAGNVGTATTPMIRIDKTKPTTSVTATFSDGSPYPVGTWTIRTVTATLTCSDDGGSGLTSPATTTRVFVDWGTNWVVSCMDAAGNQTPLGYGPILVDQRAPVINPPLVLAGGSYYSRGSWTNKTVTVQWQCLDLGKSGVKSHTPLQTFASDVANGIATDTCTDNAGNTTSLSVGGIDVDKTAPTAALVLTTADGNAYTPGSWTNQVVTAHVLCTDALSGVRSTSGDVTVSTEGTDQHAAGTCTDVAGNTVSLTSGPIDIDTTAPAITASAGAYAGGWTADDVVVSFSCVDEGSGVASLTAPVTISTDAADAGVAGTCVDAAGNSASTSVDHIDVDKTPPTIAGTPSATGWTNAPVTVTFTCADSGSGVASCSEPVTVSTEGAGQSVTGTATDNVGRTATTTVGGIDIDLTAPLVSFSGNEGTYGILDTIAITCSANDFLSGLAGSTCPGAAGPAWQIGSGTLTATATDRAGNTATVATSWTVVVRWDDLCTLVGRLVGNHGIANALCAKLDAHQAGAFVNQVRAQRGKAIGAEDADALIRLAGQL